MHRSVDKNNPIGQALFHAAVQLTVPTVNPTTTILNESPLVYSTYPDDYRSTGKTRYCVSSLSIAFLKPPNIKKCANESRVNVTKETNNEDENRNFLTIPSEKNMSPRMNLSKSEESLSVAEYRQHSLSVTSSPTRPHRSIRTTLRDLWQGLSNEDLPTISTTKKQVEKSTKRVNLQFIILFLLTFTIFHFHLKKTPSWKAFATVVTSLLTFTRTKKERYQWIQLVGHPGLRIVHR